MITERLLAAGNNDHGRGGGVAKVLSISTLWETDYFVGDVTPLIFENLKSKIRAQPPEYIFSPHEFFLFISIYAHGS